MGGESVYKDTPESAVAKRFRSLYQGWNKPHLYGRRKENIHINGRGDKKATLIPMLWGSVRWFLLEWYDAQVEGV